MITIKIINQANLAKLEPVVCPTFLVISEFGLNYDNICNSSVLENIFHNNLFVFWLEVFIFSKYRQYIRLYLCAMPVGILPT